MLVTRGLDGRLVALGFGYENGKRAEDSKVLTQAFYGEGAAIPLGGGDYVLQVACSATIIKGKIYASFIGGKESPYRAYTMYGTVAQARRKGYGWLSLDFLNEGSKAESVYKKHRVSTAQNVFKYAAVRIIPSDLPRPAAVSLFRDLIALEMNSEQEDMPALFQKTDSDLHATDEEKRAIVLNDSKSCYRAQMEGNPGPLEVGNNH